MGIRGSTRRRADMSDTDTGEENREDGARASASGEDSASGNTDHLATILSYLIRSGQVRILASGMYDDGEDNDEMYMDEDENEFVGPASPPVGDPNPDTTAIDSSELKQVIQQQSGMCHLKGCGKKPTHASVSQLLRKREIGMNGRQCFSDGVCCVMSANFLPNSQEIIARYHHKAFCGTYSTEGNVFLTACQDQNIRIYDTTCGQFRMFKSIRAREVGWSILDTAFSPDGNYLIYSSWSEAIHLCNIHSDYETHDALHVAPEGEHSFCIFSVTFSMDNSEILGGANDGCMYVYDRERRERTMRIDAHEDDVNAVAFADMTSHILFSGGDDGLVKVWDRRTLSEESPNPVGVFAGHMDGITFIDSKGDARYLLSNCKDQTIKLWDIRKFSSKEAQEATRREVAKQNWDYRWQSVPRKVKSKKKIPGDSSLMTYRGHSILHTLVRSRFSPAFTTGQRYIYSGCATGSIVIYDVLTGEIVSKLGGHRACVRDVSWHPYDNNIMSTSWDGSVAQWTYGNRGSTSDAEESGDEDSDDSGPRQVTRRSKRLRQRQQRDNRFLMLPS